MTALQTREDDDLLAHSRLARPVRWGQWLAAAVVLALIAALLHSALTNPRFDWADFRHYFFVHSILRGLALTIWLTLLTFVLGHLLGVALLAMRLSSNPVLATVAFGYSWLFRSIPPLVQLLFWYNLAAVYPLITFGLPGVHIRTVTLFSATGAAILGLTLDVAAFSAEIMRGGVIAVEAGQIEAAKAVGLRKGWIFRRIIMPQAMVSILPNTGNLLISMLKATSIVSVLGARDLLYSVQIIYNNNFKFIPLLMVATVWYVILTTVCSIAQYFVERHFGRGRNSSPSNRGFWQVLRSNASPLGPRIQTPVASA